MNEETYHSYIAFCGRHLYKKYGQLIDALLLRRIYTMGLEYPEGVRGNNGHVYHHGVIVMAPEDITPELSALFPEILPDRWHHDERKREAPTGPIAPPNHPFAIRI